MNVLDIQDLFVCDSTSPWVGTPLNDFYLLNPKAKGLQGEKITASLLTVLGYKVEFNTTADKDYDLIVNGKKTEVKFSLSSKRNYNWEFTFNHIGFKKKWDQIIFVGINGDMNIHITKYNKEDIPFELFSPQQGGKKGNNDDFMSAGKKSTILLAGGKCILNGMGENSEY